MRLIGEIIDILSSGEANLKTALLKTKVLLFQLGEKGLSEWVDNELKGYKSEDNLPSYRVLHITIKGNVITPGRFESKEGESLKNLIDYAGGFKENAYTKSVKITRIFDDKLKIVDVNSDQFEFFTPVNGDVIEVDQIVMKYENRLLADRQVTPFLVILRDYASQKQQEPCSILEFINDNIKADYQITSFPSDAVEYLLLSGRAVVIFDGLDELTNTSDRKKKSG